MVRLRPILLVLSEQERRRAASQAVLRFFASCIIYFLVMWDK